MSNSVNLVFDNTITRLAGFPYGVTIFEEQVKNQINLNKPCQIVFPNNIKKIASSFVQGFFSEIVNEVGYARIEKNVTLVTSSEELTRDIWDKLL